LGSLSIEQAALLAAARGVSSSTPTDTLETQYAYRVPHLDLPRTP
jgi:hypothetical protein